MDLDIVHHRTPDNIARTIAALVEMNAFYGDNTNRRLPPNLFSTSHGALDVLGTVGDGLAYEDLLPRSIQIDLEGKALKRSTSRC